MKRTLGLSAMMAAFLMPASLLGESFELGQVSVTDDAELSGIFSETIDAQQIETFNDNTIAEALSRTTGVAFYDRGGRAETDIKIRGFDSRRIGVFIDGVPVYVPYDGNMDYSRFLTANIGSIDVYKGFSPVAFGANTMGGVVNIVTKKPSRPFEGNVFVQANADNDGVLASTLLGTNIGILEHNVYVQLSAVGNNRDHSLLPESYDATPYQPEGQRYNSASSDAQVNAKVGYLLDDGEIALGYAHQHATKEQPPITDPVYGREKYWDWPRWDRQGLYAIGEHALLGGVIKATLYYDEYDNRLYAYDDISMTTMNKKSAFKSNYNESSYGARLQYTVDAASNRLTLSSNYKKDRHKGYDLDKTTNEKSLSESFEDTTLSFGIEDRYRFLERYILVAGVGYDIKSSNLISDPDVADNGDETAWNPQAALIAELAAKQTLRLSVAQKTYFPSMKDRYSYKLGYGVPNGDLKPEKAIHNELAYKGVIDNAWVLNAALFYSVIEDYIQAVYFDTYEGQERTQNQNVGTYYRSGVELGLAYLAERFETGANASFMDVESSSEAELIGVPTTEYNVYLRAFAADAFSGLFALNGQSGAYGQMADSSYVKLDDVLTMDISVAYRPAEGFSAELGVKNLADALNYYDDGYPERGREYYAKLEYRF